MGFRHGTLTGYVDHRCRCDDCKRRMGEWRRSRARVKVAAGLPPGDARHGTPAGYRDYGCRCEACLVSIEGARERWQESQGAKPTRHGTRRGYQGGCRCDECGRAQREYMDRYLASRSIKHGTAYAYRDLGCRCDPCREAGRAQRRGRESK